MYAFKADNNHAYQQLRLQAVGSISIDALLFKTTAERLETDSLYAAVGQ